MSKAAFLCLLALPMTAAFTAPVTGFSVSTLRAGRSPIAANPLGQPLAAASRGFLFGRVSSSAATSVTMAAKPVVKIAVGLVGTGVVGGELFKQFEQTKAKLLKDDKIDLVVAAVSSFKDNKSWMFADAKGVTTSSFDAAFKDTSAGEDCDFTKMAKFCQSVAPNVVMVDCTAAEAVSEMYLPWLEAGCNVVTPNKKVGSGPLARYKACKAAMEKTGAQWGYETTVGAGLPIIGTLKTDLLSTGDKPLKVEGIFSGTLSYIFNTYKPGMSFSAVIDDAKNKGFTEPDPRDDLSGTDVQRKVVILARECGMDIDMKDVPVDSLVPAALKDWNPPAGTKVGDAFVAEMKAYDEEKASQIKAAADKGMVLRYVGVVDLMAKKAKVTLAEYPNTHPFAGTQYADNICAFGTERYVPQPLVIQGPGAGAAVTAAGVYADIIRIAKSC